MHPDRANPSQQEIQNDSDDPRKQTAPAQNERDEKSTPKFRMRLGLRAQHVLIFLAVSLVPLFVISMILKTLSENVLKDSIAESWVLAAKDKVHLADMAIERKLAQIRTELNVPGLRYAVARSHSAENSKVVFMQVWGDLAASIRAIERYAGVVTIANAKGEVLRSNIFALDYNTYNARPHNVKQRAWWQNAYNSGLGYDVLEDIRYDPKRRRHLLPVAIPIFDIESPRKAIGVLRTVVYLPELSDLVVPDVSDIRIVLMSGSGKIIAASPKSGYSIGDDIVKSNAAMSAIVEAKRGRTGKYHGYESHGETGIREATWVYGWARTKRPKPWKAEQNFSNWIALIAYPTAQVYAGVAKLNQFVIWVTIISCIIVVPFAYIVAQRITQPIMQLTHAAKRIGREAKEVIQVDSEAGSSQKVDMRSLRNRAVDEKFGGQIAVNSKNEVGMLAQEFNDMQQNLKTAVEKLIDAEQQMTAIVDNLGEGLIVVDTHDNLLYVNPVAKRLLNYSPTSPFPTRFTELVSATNLTVLADAQGKDARVTVELNFDQDGANRVLRVVASQFSSVKGNTASETDEHIGGTVYVFDDITREHEIDRMKSDFVSLVSHELRTPLTSIIGFISLVLEGKTGPLNDGQQKSLTRAHRQSQRLAELINDLLDVSRIEAGRIQMKLQQVNLVDIAQQRLEELRPPADEKEIKLVLDVQTDLPSLTGDAEHLGQVFTNLLGNAIKFTPPNGEVIVRLSRRRWPIGDTPADTMNGAEGIYTEVIDTGPGIPIQEREMVFDKFKQLSNVQTRQQGGTGLGLSIARGFVEAHHGKIWVDAGENGKGCNFQIWLPYNLTDE